MELLQVHVAFRHGARLPGAEWPGSTWAKDEVDWSPTMEGKMELGGGVRRVLIRDSIDSEWLAFTRIRADGSTTPPDGTGAFDVLEGGVFAGDLTTKGMGDALQLGERLRLLYRSLLADDTSTALEQLEVRSTPMRRTIDTARGVLTGLFGGDDGKMDPPVPIALNVDRIGQDWMVFQPFSKFNPDQRLVAMMEAGWEPLKANPPPELIQEAEQLTGWTLPDAHDPDLEFSCLISAYDELHCRLYHGLMPETEELLKLRKSLEQRFAVEFAQACSGPEGNNRLEALRRGIGGVWREQLARIDAMVENREGAALCLYSGHDFTVFPMMLCLVPNWGEGAEDTIGGGLTQWTPFCGDCATELWLDHQASGDGRYKVRQLYRGVPLVLDHTDDDGICTLSAFRQYIAPVTQNPGDMARL